MRKQEEPYLTGNLTAMIDVVFQLIIFFVCTVSMQEAPMDQLLQLSDAPHGEPVVNKDPREVTIDVDRNGRMSIARTPLSRGEMVIILKKTVSDFGGNPDNVPIVLRGDSTVLHEKIQPALDACSEAGIIKVKFAAMKERVSKK